MALSSIDLGNEVAVVTGGGRGIGRAIALRLASAGAKVAVVARSENEIAETSRLIQHVRGQAKPFSGDVTNTGVMSSMFTEIERTFGPVSILVNNAGIIGPIAPFWEAPLKEWWRVVDVNLRGPALCSHLVLPGMVARRRGRIINLISGGGGLLADVLFWIHRQQGRACSLQRSPGRRGQAKWDIRLRARARHGTHRHERIFFELSRREEMDSLVFSHL